MNRKIGILGGTFSPIHNGHIYIAKTALAVMNLDEVWFVVASIPPHKEVEDGVDCFQRFEMCKIALKDEDKFIAKDIELYENKKCYTYETLEKLTKEYPQDEFYFIMGEDSLDSFTDWVNPKRISELATILVAVREDNKSEVGQSRLLQIDRKTKDFEKKYPGRFISIASTCVPVSSSKLREYVKDGNDEELLKYIPNEVLTYIKERRIYNVKDIEYDSENIRIALKDSLKEKRYYHSLRVADTAQALALRYRYPEGIAYLAGLLHDCAKHMPEDEMPAYCEKNGVAISKTAREARYLLHGPAGSVLAKEKFGITDKEVLHAISVHTTGCANMSLLDKIIFIADYIEPGRKRSKALPQIRAMAYNNIDVCLLMIFEETFEYLKEGNRTIDETALEAYNYYKNGE